MKFEIVMREELKNVQDIEYQIKQALEDIFGYNTCHSVKEIKEEPE